MCEHSQPLFAVPAVNSLPLNPSRSLALVHEWLTPSATGGSELVVREILRHLEADVFALIDFESRNPASYLYGRTIGTSFLQQFPWAEAGVQKYLPLLPLAIEQLDLGAYDIILSSSHAVAKGVLTRSHQLHLCYCHAPMRYAWDLTFEYLQASRLGRGLPGLATRLLLHYLRQWDVVAANRVDYFIANSQHTARRIWRCYRREAEVIYPPVELSRFTYRTEKEDFYLTVSRLVSYKQVELIVRAFNDLGWPLVIIGDGPERARLSQLARNNVQLLGGQPDTVVADYMARARAFVYAAWEDFGIAPVEAQACGTPVIAYGAGGVLETVCDWRQSDQAATGIHFYPQTPAALGAALREFAARPGAIAPEACHQQAQRFAPPVFRDRYLATLERCQRQWFASQPPATLPVPKA